MTSTVRGVDNFDSSPVRSIIRLHTANGVGSVYTAIRRWLTVTQSQGTDITYTDSATQGSLFLINVPGVYAISYTDNFGNANELGVSLNAVEFATSVSLIAASTRLGNATTAGLSFAANVGWVGYLPAGSQIRSHCNVSPAAATNGRSNFTIARVF